MRRRMLAVAALTASLAACGGGSSSGGGDLAPEKLAAKLDAACTKAAATIAALAAPTDDASFESYMEGFSAATSRVYTVAYDLDSDDLDLLWFSGAVGQFRSLIGAWTPVSLSWKSLAIARDVDAAASALGATACSGETWQPQRFTEFLATNGHGQSDAEFRAALNGACAAAFGSFSVSSEAGDLGNVITGASATRALGDFERTASFLDPPAALAEQFLDVLEPLVTVEAVSPDVAVELSPERRQRITDQGARIDTALAALEVRCTA